MHEGGEECGDLAVAQRPAADEMLFQTFIAAGIGDGDERNIRN